MRPHDRCGSCYLMHARAPGLWCAWCSSRWLRRRRREVRVEQSEQSEQRACAAEPSRAQRCQRARATPGPPPPPPRHSVCAQRCATPGLPLGSRSASAPLRAPPRPPGLGPAHPPRSRARWLPLAPPRRGEGVLGRAMLRDAACLSWMGLQAGCDAPR